MRFLKALFTLLTSVSCTYAYITIDFHVPYVEPAQPGTRGAFLTPSGEWMRHARETARANVPDNANIRLLLTDYGTQHLGTHGFWASTTPVSGRVQVFAVGSSSSQPAARLRAERLRHRVLSILRNNSRLTYVNASKSRRWLQRFRNHSSRRWPNR